jgi:hypothetical protein
MIHWGRFFSKAENSGVLAIEEASSREIRKAAQDADLAFFHLDLAHVTGKESFMKAAAKSFEFPAYFGANWDAFEDCLTDFSWHEAGGFVLLIEGVEDFARAFPEIMETARDIFENAAGYWKDLATCFFVVLADHFEPTRRLS